MEMMQYRPWAEDEVKSLINEVPNRKLLVLDLQLGGGCGNNCSYCDDSGRRGYSCSVNMDSVRKLIENGDIKAVYVCGIGEPLHCTNLRKLNELLEICHDKGIYVSMYTSLPHLSDNILKYIDDGTLNLLYKYDTENINKAMRIYGQSREKALQYFINYLSLGNVIHNENGITNIGASIVPSSVNSSELKKLVNCCLVNGIFPMIGELENSGSCTSNYDQLKVDEKDLQKTKDWMQDKYNIDYKIPTCPATIAGIHVNNFGNVIVDEKTGLSCSWFWLEQPKMTTIGNINNMGYDEIVDRIFDYRDSRYQAVCDYVENMAEHPFGGCGGDAKSLLKTYTGIYQPGK